MRSVIDLFLNPKKKTAQDLSRQTEDTYILIKPLATDEQGEVLNETLEPKLVKGEKVNVYDKIQDYVDECDVYKIIERATMTGDMSLLNQVPRTQYGDVSNIPTNINDLNATLGSNINALTKAVGGDKSLIIDALGDGAIDSIVNAVMAKVAAKNKAAVKPIEGGAE